MKTVKIYSLLLSLALLLGACASTGNVFTDVDPAQDFSEYKTFTWLGDRPLNVVGDRIISSFVTSKLKNAVERELVSKGYVLASNAEEADLAVGYTIGARDKIRERLLPGRRVVFDPWMYRNDWRWGQGYYDFTYTEPVTTIQEYTEGSLAIDIFDVKRNSPVWHGLANKRLTNKELNATDGGNVEEAVRVLLSSMPAVN